MSLLAFAPGIGKGEGHKERWPWPKGEPISCTMAVCWLALIVAAIAVAAPITVPVLTITGRSRSAYYTFRSAKMADVFRVDNCGESAAPRSLG
jgi:hypothetical protein